jgi:misacylated tRNA(Ala) deacylase
MELVFRDDAYAKTCSARVVAAGPSGILLDRTVFYPTGGGQPGDTGLLRTASGREIRIANTVKGDGPDQVVHLPAEGSALPEPGEEVTAVLDWDRRYSHMRIHTCLHLLCVVVPGPVTGGAISEGKGRLDFDLAAAPDKDAVTAGLNALIASGKEVDTIWITDEEMAAQPELVRTMSVKPPMGHGRVRLLRIADTDLQPCGGTHVRNTAEIGRVEVTKIESKGKQNRRIIIGFAG